VTWDFSEKERQVEPGRIQVFGIHVESRYQKADELIEMMQFCYIATREGLNFWIKELFYDSKACMCNIEFHDLDLMKMPQNEQDKLFSIADRVLDQFQWVDGCIYGKQSDGPIIW